MRCTMIILLCFIAVASAADSQWESGCGVSKFADAGEGQGTPFIVGGVEARVHELPWQTSLRRNTGSHFCGGFLIKPEWVVTAAHCVTSGDPGAQYVVYNNHYQAGDGTEVPVTQVIVHELYGSAGFDYDIALLRLQTPVTITENVNTVCKPTNESYAGLQTSVSGWGTTSSGGSAPLKLRYANVNITTNEACQNAYTGEVISPRMICASYLGRDSCQGDSGGPIAYKRDGVFEVVGIVSWGYGCADPSYPGVYTRVSPFNDWIDDKTQS